MSTTSGFHSMCTYTFSIGHIEYQLHKPVRRLGGTTFSSAWPRGALNRNSRGESKCSVSSGKRTKVCTGLLDDEEDQGSTWIAHAHAGVRITLRGGC